MNFLLDRDVTHWSAELARLKAEVGVCTAVEPIEARSAMEATFSWSCEHGRIRGSLLLAPTTEPMLQALEYNVSKP